MRLKWRFTTEEIGKTFHMQMKTLERVSIGISLHVLAHNLKRVTQIMLTVPVMGAMRA
ncbi:MAG: hypothetical protein IIB73_08825 [Proteobacteria bacterium]|nr:hypothetical protein [Pseudomonadota bacterium]